MEGMTLDEFKETLTDGWEIDFTIGESNFHYQRSDQDDVFQLYLTTDSETIFEMETNDMDAVVKEILALPICAGKTIEQLAAKITVVSSS